MHTQRTTIEYVSLDDAAFQLHVTTDYLLGILDDHGLTPMIRATIGKDISIRKSDLQSLSQVLQDALHASGAA